MISKKRLQNRFIRYVKIDSLSKKEGRFFAYIKNELSKSGIRAYEDSAAHFLCSEVGNLYAHLKGNVKKAPRILINAHLDTVVPGTKIKPRIKKGIIYSDGTTILGADNKAGVAVMVEVLSVIKESNIPHGPIDVIFTVAEEIGLCGSKYIDKNFLKADFGYVLDGGDIDIIINKAPSQDSIDIKITGKAAHAGVHPEDGINAIKVASEAISKMKLGRIDKETTNNIGIIKGGLATNIVPEEVVLNGEARSHNNKKLRQQGINIKKALIDACRKYKAKLDYKVTTAYKAFEVKKKHRALKIAISAAEKVGFKPKVRATGGGSDANVFGSYGVPCLIIGVGADKVHTKKENIAIDDMYKGAQFLLEIIKEAGNNNN